MGKLFLSMETMVHLITPHTYQGRDSQRFLSKSSYLSTTFVVIFMYFMLYLSTNCYLRIFVNPGPGPRFSSQTKLKWLVTSL